MPYGRGSRETLERKRRRQQQLIPSLGCADRVTATTSCVPHTGSISTQSTRWGTQQGCGLPAQRSAELWQGLRPGLRPHPSRVLLGDGTRRLDRGAQPRGRPAGARSAPERALVTVCVCARSLTSTSSVTGSAGRPGSWTVDPSV